MKADPNQDPGAARILLIHFGQLGDAVIALPAARALRAHFPQAALTVLAARGGDAIFRMAGFDEVWSADRARWRRAPAAALLEIPGLVWRLRRQRFDLAVDLHSFKETNWLAFAAGIPKRVAMLRPTRSVPRLITHKPPPDDPDGRLLDRYCRVLEPLGIAVADRIPRLDAPPEAACRVQAEFAAWAEAAATDAPVLGLCPGAGHPGRRWPHFVALARAFLECHPARVAVFAGPEESPALLAPFAALPAARIWRLTLPELAAALGLCRVVVSNPTGPAHLAAAVGTRLLVLGEIPAFDPVASDRGNWERPRAERASVAGNRSPPSSDQRERPSKKWRATPAAIRILRARREVPDIEPAPALAALLDLWTA